MHWTQRYKQKLYISHWKARIWLPMAFKTIPDTPAEATKPSFRKVSPPPAKLRILFPAHLWVREFWPQIYSLWQSLDWGLLSNILASTKHITRPLERAANRIKGTRPCSFRLPPWENVHRSTTLIHHMWVRHLINCSWEITQFRWCHVSYLNLLCRFSHKASVQMKRTQSFSSVELQQPVPTDGCANYRSPQVSLHLHLNLVQCA